MYVVLFCVLFIFCNGVYYMMCIIFEIWNLGEIFYKLLVLKLLFENFLYDI